MKIEKTLIGLALAFILVGISSCNNDDEPDKPKVEKQLVKITGELSLNRGESTGIVWGSDGKIQAAGDDTYTYTENQIVVTDKYGDRIYKLKNGLILEDDEGWKFEYADNRLVKWEYSSEVVTFTWENGDITEMESDHEIKLVYSYASSNDFGGVNAFHQSDSFLYDDLDPILVMQGFFGTMPIHLVQRCIRTSRGYHGSLEADEYQWEYELDSDGYVNTMIETFSDGRKFDTEFSWVNK